MTDSTTLTPRTDALMRKLHDEAKMRLKSPVPIQDPFEQAIELCASLERSFSDEKHRLETAKGLLINVLAGHRVDAYPPERQMLEKCLELLK